MRTFTIVAAMALLLSACTSAVVAGGPVELRIAGSGAFAAETERKALAVFDDETYTALWAATIDEHGEMAPIDFSTESAVVLFGGQRNTGGYAIDVRGATIEGETLVVDAVVKGPPGGSIVTQVLTQPWTVIAVKNRRFKDVRWDR